MKWRLKFAAWAASWLPRSVVQALYRLGPISSGIRRLLNRAAPTDRAQVQVAGGLLRGAIFELDLQREKDLWLGTVEPAVQRLIKARVVSGMVVYDVGANLGYFTVAMAKAVGPGGKVVAFEPLPANIDRLRHALASNGVRDRVAVVPAAVSDAVGRGQFHTGDSGRIGRLAGASGRNTEFTGSVEVDITSLDTYVYSGEQPAPEWIKLDIEGGEAKALTGAARLLAEQRPECLIELHGPEAARSVFHQLEQNDYEILGVEPPHQPISVDQVDWRDHIWARPRSRANHGQ